MADEKTKPPTTGQILYDKGWRQGSIFKLEGSSVNFHNSQIIEGKPTIGVGRKPVKNNQILVVVSQECDIVAPDGEEPYIEAMVCRTDKAAFVSRIRNRSPRYFAVNPDENFVAVAPYKLQIEKSVLLQLTPQSWPSTEENLNLFIRWLATRYDRPAVPNEIVEVFDRPVRIALEQLGEDQPKIMDAFNNAIREIRVTPSLTENPPYEVHTTLLGRSAKLTEEELEAINRVYKAILSCVNSQQVSLDSEPRLVTAEMLSLADYERTRLFALEFFSYEGDTGSGALPVARS